MKRILPLLLVFTLAVSLSAESTKIEEADKLHENVGYEAEILLLEDELAYAGSDNEKSEILWRMSRVTLAIADQMELDGASKNELLKEFQMAWDYAAKSIFLNSDNYNAYYWRASSIGSRGRTKGILDSLLQADDMKDDLERAVNSNPTHGDSYHILGMLYGSVPGLISFGNKEYAVSLARKAIDNQDESDRPYNYSYYLELAKHLWSRKWNEGKRISKQKKERDRFASKSSEMEKSWYYDGFVDLTNATVYSTGGIKNMSDREEAVAILNWVLPELDKLSNKKPDDYEYIEEVEKLLGKWE